MLHFSTTSLCCRRAVIVSAEPLTHLLAWPAVAGHNSCLLQLTC